MVFQQKYQIFKDEYNLFSDVENFFLGEDYRCFFWQKGNFIFLTFIHIHRKYHICMYFLRKIFFYFPSKEKISYFREKRNTIFPDITKKIIFEWHFLERPSFQKMWRKKIWFFVEWCFCNPRIITTKIDILSVIFIIYKRQHYCSQTIY